MKKKICGWLKFVTLLRENVAWTDVSNYYILSFLRLDRESADWSVLFGNGYKGLVWKFCLPDVQVLRKWTFHYYVFPETSQRGKTMRTLVSYYFESRRHATPRWMSDVRQNRTVHAREYLPREYLGEPNRPTLLFGFCLFLIV